MSEVLKYTKKISARVFFVANVLLSGGRATQAEYSPTINSGASSTLAEDIRSLNTIISFPEQEDPVLIPVETPTANPDNSNVRATPSTTADILGTTSSSEFNLTNAVALGYVRTSNGNWIYFDFNFDNQRGFIRQDVLSGVMFESQLPDLTDVGNLSVVSDSGETILAVNSGINLAWLHAAKNRLIELGLPSETFNRENIVILPPQPNRSDIVLQQINPVINSDERVNEPGSTIVIIPSDSDPFALDAINFLGPGQISTIFDSDGLPSDVTFAPQGPTGFFRLNETSLFSVTLFNQSLNQNLPQETAIRAATIISEQPFPLDDFSIRDSMLIFPDVRSDLIRTEAGYFTVNLQPTPVQEGAMANENNQQFESVQFNEDGRLEGATLSEIASIETADSSFTFYAPEGFFESKEITFNGLDPNLATELENFITQENLYNLRNRNIRILLVGGIARSIRNGMAIEPMRMSTRAGTTDQLFVSVGVGTEVTDNSVNVRIYTAPLSMMDSNMSPSIAYRFISASIIDGLIATHFSLGNDDFNPDRLIINGGNYWWQKVLAFTQKFPNNSFIN